MFFLSQKVVRVTKGPQRVIGSVLIASQECSLIGWMCGLGLSTVGTCPDDMNTLV